MPRPDNLCGPPKALPRGIIFDCDGVLLDSLQMCRQVYNRIRLNLGLGAMSPDQEKFVFTHSAKESIEHLFGPALQEKARRAKTAIRPMDYLPWVRLQPGIRRLLGSLRGWGVPMAVNTNSGHRAGIIFEHFGLSGFFDAVVTADDVPSPKPAPDGVHRILGKWAFDPKGVVYIGDSHIDRDTAQNAGVTFWAYGNRDLEAHWHVHGFDELVRVLTPLAQGRRALAAGG